jgi:hypothetical protein
MAEVDTNSFSLAYARETSFGVPPTSGWKTLQVSDSPKIGASITAETPTIISKNRQRVKGSVTDLESTVEFSAPSSMGLIDAFIEELMFSRAVNAEMDINTTTVNGTLEEFNVSALTALQAGKLKFSAGEYATLINARNFSTPTNNGLHALALLPAVGATAVRVTTDLTAETAPAEARIELAGLRLLAANTDLAYAYSAVTKRATLTVTGVTGFSWLTLGLTVGQFIAIGSRSASTGLIINGLQGTVANDGYGYGRVVAATTNVLTLDKLPANLQVASMTSSTIVDFLFGKFVRNVPVDNPAYLSQSIVFEGTYPNLGAGGLPAYEYSIGNYANTLDIELSEASLATASVAFVGRDTEPLVTTRKTGASTALPPMRTGSVNTTSDLARLRITEYDQDGLTTDFTSLTFKINNNIEGQKVLGFLGSKFVGTGEFQIDIDAEVIFTSPLIAEKIRSNETLTMDFGIKNEDGGVMFDVPSLTLSGGEKTFEANKKITISLTCQAFGDNIFGTSLGVSLFPVAI